MADEIRDLRRLVIKAFHMTDVEWGDHNDITVDGHMTVSKEMIDQLVAEEEYLEKIDIQIIKPGDHDRWTNTIMDIIPISTKVLGKVGDGITHTLTGVYVILTGVEKVCLDFGRETEQPLDTMTVAEAERYIEEGQFEEGTMLPKIQAAVEFIGNSAVRSALITRLDTTREGLDGRTGTVIHK